MFSLDLKGRFKATLAILYIANGDILRKIFWHISALVLEHYYNIIKGRLYANHMSDIKASLYDTTRSSLCAANSRLLMRWAELSMRKGSY